MAQIRNKDSSTEVVCEFYSLRKEGQAVVWKAQQSGECGAKKKLRCTTFISTETENVGERSSRKLLYAGSVVRCLDYQKFG